MKKSKKEVSENFQNMACGVSMERYDPGEQDWIVFNNFWPKEVSEKVKKRK